MATATQIKALIDSYGSGDDARFRSVAMQIAASAAKKGQQRLADQLREMLETMPRQPVTSPTVGRARAVPISKPPESLEELVVASYPNTKLADMVLADRHRQMLETLVKEYRDRDALEAHGLTPRRRLLLVGPPGCGKTMTAAALAGQCKLPLIEVQLHSLMSRYLGETATRLFQIFEVMGKSPGVYLFDEFDAIGAVRDASGDVGEVRRVLNSFLQFLERYDGQGFVVAATNLLSLLDHALHRRFDAIMHYALPEPGDAQNLIKNRLSAFKLSIDDWEAIEKASSGLSHADIVASAEAAARQIVLSGGKCIRIDNLLDCLTERSAVRSPMTSTCDAARQPTVTPSSDS
ncbi:AAA family ATPase [Neorhodopirellula lusitana]|nr:AAA family ATPase [Neorhodopirellula lusitana]